ncbi:hypothetical protein ACFL47_02045 [Candidatus Latescibacterota bacterium]
MRIPALILLSLIMVMIVCSGSLLAQENFEELLNKSRKEFESLKKEADDNFNTLKKSMDDEFADVLNKAWKELEVSTGRKFDEEPKPDTVPVARPEPVPPEKPKEEPPKVVPEKAPEKVPEKSPETKKPEPEEPKKTVEEKKPPITKKPEPKPSPPVPVSGDQVSFIFYDTPLAVPCDKRMKVSTGNTVNEKSIGAYWAAMSKTNFMPCLKRIIGIKQELQLNDWGYCMLLDALGQAVYGRSTNQRNMFAWFMLVQSGFDARIGHSDNRVYLLLPALHKLYGLPFYDMGGATYYITSLGSTPPSVKSMYTYEGKHKGATRKVDMNVYTAPGITKKITRKNYDFSYYDKDYSIPLSVNTNMVDFYEYYPQTNLDVYFDASISQESRRTLLEGLRPVVSGKNEIEAVNLLLRFVQKGFDYKTDDEQFQREKHFFIEETIFYPFCDCEDRSFLFAFLVRNLVGLDVIGLHYPGHVATAVKFSTAVRGDPVTYKNERYVVCDPTYINANYGECMPKFKTVTPEIVQIETK